MNKFAVTQVFTIGVALVLMFTLGVILLANSLTQYRQYQLFITPLLLIILAIIGLAIFSILAKMYYSLETGKKKRK